LLEREEQMVSDDPLFDTPEAAEYVHSGQSTLEKKRLTGGGPTFIKLGRKVVYRRSDLDAWLNARRRRSTSEYSTLPHVDAAA
jgi:predicted DNA-binding transcriptional regulator AlpA